MPYIWNESYGLVGFSDARGEPLHGRNNANDISINDMNFFANIELIT